MLSKNYSPEAVFLLQGCIFIFEEILVLSDKHFAECDHVENIGFSV